MHHSGFSVIFLSLLAGASADAHGIWGHIHVTGWAIENLPPGELSDFLSEPEVMNAALYGAAYCDSGYFPRDEAVNRYSRIYGEHNHWEPFVENYVQWMAVNDPPPWDDLESRKRIGFLMGVAAHGLQDELFDSLFLYQVAYHDDGSQENADPGTDGFFAQDGWIRFIPEPYYPVELLLEVYAPLGPEITEDIIANGNDLMQRVYVNDTLGPIVAESNGDLYRPELPWTAEHYLDPDIPGSLRSEIVPTARYMESIWERLHDRWEEEDLVIHTYPELPRQLLTGDNENPGSWLTLVFGRGVQTNTASFTLEDGEGSGVEFVRRSTRWGGEGSWSRLARVEPSEPLAPGAEYRLELQAGTTMIGLDDPTASAWSMQFVVACPDDPESCPALDGEPFIPEIGDPILPEEPVDPGADVGVDAGADDVGNDADAEDPDTDVPDSGDTQDSGDTSGEADTADADARPELVDIELDTLADAGADASNDGTASASGDSDDGCAASPGSERGLPGFLLAAASAFFIRRRRTR
jgi:hypothetical protein